MASVLGVHGERIALMQRRRWARKGSPNQRTTAPSANAHQSTHLRPSRWFQPFPSIGVLMANFRMARGMPHVIHVGPCDSPGGIRTVMRTLAEHPPEGWTASLLASHAPTRVAMLRAARKAARALRRLPDDASTLVHLHAASDWSLRRKLRLAAVCKAPVVLHLHSGDTARWLQASAKRVDRIRSAIQRHVDAVVVLDSAWKDVLEPLLGSVDVVPNPVHPMHQPAEGGHQESERLLVMGRDAVVKRRDFALDVLASVRQQRPSVHLHLTGGHPQEGDGWTRHGWLSEAERLALLHNSSVLLLPSRFEGQPLAALESLACGIPVIADADLVGLPETVARPSEATVEAWTTAVLETLSSSVDTDVLAASVAHHAVERVASRWTEVYAMAFERRDG